MDRSRLARIGIVAGMGIVVAVILSLAVRQARPPEPESSAPTAPPAQTEGSFPPVTVPARPAAPARPGATTSAAHLAPAPVTAPSVPAVGGAAASMPPDHPPVEPVPDEKSQVSIQWIGESEFVIDSP